MAHNVTSQVVTDQDATPIAKTSQIKLGGGIRSAYGSLTVVATTAAQTMNFARIPVRARIVDVKVTNATMGNGSVKIGAFRPSGGIAISDACFTAAVALTARARASVFDEVTLNSPAQSSLAFSSVMSTAIGTAGATADQYFDVVASVVTVSTGTAVVAGLEVQYVLPE